MTTQIESFTVVGFETRTSNAREMSGSGFIASLWGKVLGEDPGDETRVALYTEYESDRDGDYTYLLGAKANPPGDFAPGKVSREVVAGSYAVFISDFDGLPQTVIALWQQIWSLEDSGQLARSYKTDFEIYEHGKVSIYIGVKE